MKRIGFVAAIFFGVTGDRCGSLWAQVGSGSRLETTPSAESVAASGVSQLRESRFGYAAAASRNALIASRLAEGGAVEAAYDFLSQQLELPRGDIDAAIADAMELVRLETARRLGDAAITSATLEQLFADIVEPSSRLADRLAARIAAPASSDAAAATVLPSGGEVSLMLRFAVEQNRVELTRYLVAASSAIVGDESLRRKAAASVEICRENLTALRASSTARGSELSTLRTADASRWRNELYRLANETLLLSIDVATMQLDAAADEVAAVRAATALLNDVESTSAVFASAGGAPPMLIALRARANAVLGRQAEAIQTLSKAIDVAASPTVRRRLQLAQLDVLLTSSGPVDFDEAAHLIREILAAGDVSPELTLTILRYQLLRLRHVAGDGRTADPPSSEVLAPDSLAAMITRPPSRAAVISLRDEISARFGSHWRWRSDALILQMLPRAAAGAGSNPSADAGDYAFVDSQVAQDLLAGRLDNAVAALLAAEQQARQAGSEAVAFEFAKKRSALLHSAFARRASEGIGGELALAAQLALAEQTCRTARDYASLAGSADLHHLGVRTAVEAAGQAESSTASAAVTTLSEDHLRVFPADHRNASIAFTAEALFLHRGDFSGAVAFVDRWLAATIEKENSVADDASSSVAAEHRLTLRILQTALHFPGCKSVLPDSIPDSARAVVRAQEAVIEAIAPEGPLISPHLHAASTKQDAGPVVGVNEEINRLRSLIEGVRRPDGGMSPSLPSSELLQAYISSLASQQPPRRIAALSLLAADWAELLHHGGGKRGSIEALAELLDALRDEIGADPGEAGPLIVAIQRSVAELIERSNTLLVGYRGDWPLAATDLLALAEANPSTENLHWLARGMTLAGTDPTKPAAVLKSLRRRVPSATACWWRLTADLAVTSTSGGGKVDDAVAFLLATASPPPPRWKEYVLRQVAIPAADGE